MGLNKQYYKVGQNAKNRLFGIAPSNTRQDRPIQMLVSDQAKISHSRLAVICVGLFTLAVGIILSSVPWLDYLVLKNLRLWNGTLSYHYWQKPGVLRLTKVFIFNVTNPEGFLNQGEKPRLEEIGPFVYREDMEKINIRFHDNGTVSFQHHKILEFVPELSVDKNLKIVVPNIPLLTLTSGSNELSRLLQTSLSVVLRFMGGMTPFKTVSADELVFGYDDPLTSLANRFYPRGKRPPRKMGLFLGRNGTLDDVATINTGHRGMEYFGIMDKLNGMDHLPYWNDAPCNNINASEGSLFPPRAVTGSDVVNVYDKDLCRVWPLRHRYEMSEGGITVGYYTPDDNIFRNGDEYPDNKCYCPGSEECPVDGLQNISPCQFDAPVYLSLPHFYKADPSLSEPFEGLNPSQEKHETFFKIQPKLGVTLEARVRVQLNLKVEHAEIHPVRNFPDIVFPIMWLEEGVAELTPGIHTWVFMSTTFADHVAPVIQYGLIVIGSLTLIVVFVRAYKNLVFTAENIELGKQKLRRGSSFIVNGQHRLLIIRDSYQVLHNLREPTRPDSVHLLDGENGTEMQETSFNPDPSAES
ncbi:scavenger receptor class B member 1 isoform X1 [Homalodisca vitripennis]|uniref:scavenger receptor class B member 1 isoform X1 n=1 Tax=Homalodisca vitripennis TaxID=197043 RepID=UPI001EEAFC45|nr:scavenger receptor class B member 1 isoform X1 [Homalodisca vitripennis]